jgi:hemolysin-activating ACP:hemolysin acyltransferase
VDPDTPPLKLIRLRDPNEALGLAVRLLAGVPPFDTLPLGLSISGLVSRIDGGDYAFAQRAARAVGFVAWGFADAVVAEAWAFQGRVPQPGEVAPDKPCAMVFAMQAISPEVTRFLWSQLRDHVFAGRETAYYIRDYGKQPDGRRRTRAVRMQRPQRAAQR